MMAILLYVLDEFRYDRFHKNADRIFRINSTTRFNGSESRYSTTSTPLGEAIRQDVPEVEQVARLFNRQATIRISDSDTLNDQQKYKEDHFYFADPSIFKLFTFDIIQGNPISPVNNPNEIAISEKIAVKYYGSAEASIGKLVQLEGSIPLTVSAVYRNWPFQSHHAIELIAHFDNYFNVEIPEIREYLRTDWLYSPLQTYVLIRQDADPQAVEKRVNELNNKYADERVQRNLSYSLQPILDIHLYSEFTYETSGTGITVIFVLVVIGILILGIACINFINLATVSSLRRSREIGVRKVLGAGKTGLAVQFLSESTMLVFASLIMALIMLKLILPKVNEISGKYLTPEMLMRPEVIFGMVILFLATGLISGGYPAAYIAKFNPVTALKGLNNGVSRRELTLRRVLVVGQFSASIILIMFSVTIYRQMQFMRTKPLGFQRDLMITIPIFSDNPNSILGGGVDGPLRGRMNGFENALLQHSRIEAISVSSVLPGSGTVRALVKTEKIRETDNVFVPVISVDYDFLPTYKLELLAGRNFSRSAGTDHLQAVIANEQAVKLLGLETAEKAIGQPVEVLGKKAAIIGVIRDYHFEGLQQPLRPLLLEVNVGKFTAFSVRVSSGNMPETIETIREIWEANFPERVFEFQFLDDLLQRNYDRDQKFGELIAYFSLFAIIISGLGVFGLSAYINHQRQREASVRKVMGAGVAEVFWSLFGEFRKMIIWSVLVSIPLSYLIVSSWLEEFAYRVSIGWIPYIFTAVLLSLIVFLTTFYQTLKTAVMNPIHALKEE